MSIMLNWKWCCQRKFVANETLMTMMRWCECNIQWKCWPTILQLPSPTLCCQRGGEGKSLVWHHPNTWWKLLTAFYLNTCDDNKSSTFVNIENMYVTNQVCKRISFHIRSCNQLVCCQRCWQHTTTTTNTSRF